MSHVVRRPCVVCRGNITSSPCWCPRCKQLFHWRCISSTEDCCSRCAPDFALQDAAPAGDASPAVTTIFVQSDASPAAEVIQAPAEAPAFVDLGAVGPNDGLITAPTSEQLEWMSEHAIHLDPSARRVLNGHMPVWQAEHTVDDMRLRLPCMEQQVRCLADLNRRYKQHLTGLGDMLYVMERWPENVPPGRLHENELELARDINGLANWAKHKGLGEPGVPRNELEQTWRRVGGKMTTCWLPIPRLPETSSCLPAAGSTGSINTVNQTFREAPNSSVAPAPHAAAQSLHRLPEAGTTHLLVLPRGFLKSPPPLASAPLGPPKLPPVFKAAPPHLFPAPQDPPHVKAPPRCLSPCVKAPPKCLSPGAQCTVCLASQPRKAPPPSRWRIAFAPDGHEYYWNVDTRATSWVVQRV
jgi:hypothetical protein